ncbi:MAG: 2-phosphosulfolactate phosphatase [Pedosphaera sp.]|nr:2-phosphosulfolactate phosphatase [Pedosphaera sp.]
MYIDVILSPAEFRTLPDRHLGTAVCVVFDVLRATSTMLTALANGARAIIPVVEIAEAIARRAQNPQILLAGERDGLRIRGSLSDGVDFDFGNSPREFTADRIKGRTIVCTTTNGTRALHACAGAAAVRIASMGNLAAESDGLLRDNPASVLFICSGTGEQTALEDVLAAGALIDRIRARQRIELGDAARIALAVYRQACSNVTAAITDGQNGRRLLSITDLAPDVDVCSRRDIFPFQAGMNVAGEIFRLP